MFRGDDFAALYGGDIMRILAFDDHQGLDELQTILKELLGDKMCFHGFESADKLLKAAEKLGYDIVFADVTYQDRSGLLMLEELSFRCPRTNYVAVASDLRESDAMTMHYLHGGYIQKPYGIETLADTFSHLRYPINEAV